MEKLGDLIDLDGLRAAFAGLPDDMPLPDDPPWEYRIGGHEEGRGIPRRLAEAIQPDTIKQTEARRRLAAALNDGRVLVVLGGPPGLGKSVAAAEAVSVAPVSDGPERPKFAAADDICDWMHIDRRNLGPREWTASELSACTFLAIDDLGREYNDQAGRHLHALTRILERRYEAQLPTVVTTNITKADFAARYGARVADRIAGSGAWIQLEGRSMRR